MTSVLLSIRPPYADAIFQRSKQVEFRRIPFGREVTRVYVYSTAPTSAVVGSFAVRGIRRLSPARAWREYRGVAGISKAEFFHYFGGAKTALCIEISKPSKAKVPVDPHLVDRGFVPPQSFMYLEERTTSRLDVALGRETSKEPRRIQHVGAQYLR